MFRFFRRLLLLVGLGAAGWYAWARFGPYDPTPWLGDLSILEAHTAAAYANLDWQAARGVVDPVALHRRTDSLIRHASHRGAARRALVEFGRAFGDGHFHLRRPRPGFVDALERLVRGGGTSEELSSRLEGRAACARLGYGDRVSPSLLALAPGWREVGGGPFPHGVVPLGDGRAAGVLRIAHFGLDGYADTCADAWATYRDSLPGGAACDDDCRWRFELRLADALLAAERDAVRALAASGAELLVVDLTGNGGGTDWVDPAARQLVARPIPGILASGVRHPHHVAQLEDRRELLARDAARRDLGPGQRELLGAALARLDSALASARFPCDRSGIWRGPLPAGCGVLITPAMPNTGPAGWAPDSLLAGLDSAEELFWPSLYRYEAGTWDGPLVVLVDRHTASASEGFAGQLRDAGAALIVGARTLGAGCGYTNGGLPLRLPHSGLEARMPDCARLRADGTNEVAGIEPDEPAGWTDSDNATVIAEKALGAIGAVSGKPEVRGAGRELSRPPAASSE